MANKIVTESTDTSGFPMICDELERVTLVDMQDREIGSSNKLEAHRRGELHRGFSILLFNEQKELMLQRRADSKYHFAGRWSNTCCGHPRPGEQMHLAVSRRLREELGVKSSLDKVKDLYYYAKDPVSGFIEHEYLHIYQGQFEGEPDPNPDEVGAWRWVSIPQLKSELARHYNSFTPWFQILVTKLLR